MISSAVAFENSFASSTNTKAMITLKNVLFINGISSGVTGLGLLVFAQAIGPITGISEPITWYAVGIFLTLFGIFVLTQAKAQPLNQNRVRIITALDASWVIGSLIVVTSPVELTIIGQVGIIAVALWVALMAFLQFRGLRGITA
jgi:hypothetical protein